MDRNSSASVNLRPNDLPMTKKSDLNSDRVRNSIRSLINNPEDGLGVNEENERNEPNSSKSDGNKKPRKKRKTFSCDTCRRVKTRCDFEPFIGKCYRCNVLQLDCSLAKNKDDEILNTLREDSLLKKINSINSNLGSFSHLSKDISNEIQGCVGKSETGTIDYHTINSRLSSLEGHIKSLHQKMDLIIASASLSNNNDTEDAKKGGQFENVDLSNTYDSAPTSSSKMIKKNREI